MIKLLIADDEGFVRRGLINNIPWGELGVDFIEQADDGVNAFEKALDLKLDILLTDVRMPRMDGIALATKIREALPACKIIFMSAYSDKEYLKSAIHLKAISYIEKPLDPAEINKVITSTVELCHEEEKRRIAEYNMKKDLEESSIIFRDNLLLELIKNNFNKEILQKRIANSQIKLSLSNHFSILLFKFKPKNNTELNLNKRLNVDLLKTLEENCITCGFDCLLEFIDNENIIAIINFKTVMNNFQELEVLEKLCQKLLHELIDTYSVFISIGKVVPDVFQLSESYESAKLKARELFFKGYNTYTYSQKSSNGTFEFKDNIIQELEVYLEEFDEVKCKQLLVSLNSSIRPLMNTKVKYIKNLYFRLLMQLINSSVKRGIDLYTEETESFYWEIITSFDTLDAIEGYLIILVDDFNNIGNSSVMCCIILDLPIKGINQF